MDLYEHTFKMGPQSFFLENNISFSLTKQNVKQSDHNGQLLSFIFLTNPLLTTALLLSPLDPWNL